MVILQSSSRGTTPLQTRDLVEYTLILFREGTTANSKLPECKLLTTLPGSLKSLLNILENYDL